jgi:hypothetical protein
VVEVFDERKKHSALDIQREGICDIGGMKEHRFSDVTPLPHVIVHRYLSELLASRKKSELCTNPQLELLHRDWKNLGDVIII